MSYSSLWTLDKELKGKEKFRFNNAWLFTPIALDSLLYKYIPEKRMDTFGRKIIYIEEIAEHPETSRELNKLINNSEIIEDRIVWEMCNQQVFFSKDKGFVSKCIINFNKINNGFIGKYEEHISERAKEIATAIQSIDEPYFIFKNTSCDDGVKKLFYYYDDEIDGYIDRSLLDIEEYATEFVVIKDNKIKEFIPNTKFTNYLGGKHE